MKKYFLVLIIFLIASCKEKYHGYIYDSTDRKPIKNAEIYDIQSNKSTYTDSNGYYVLNSKPGDIFSIKKEGYIIDTIGLYSHQAGENIESNMNGDIRDLFPIWTGTIYDDSTKKTISNVSIYNLNGEKISATNFDGYFELNKILSSTLILKKENFLNDTICIFRISDIRTQTIIPLQKIKNEKYYLKLNKK